jgi:hypothetical protein
LETAGEPDECGPKLFVQIFSWLIAAIGFLCRLLLIVWATLAIYYSNLPWPVARLALAMAFALFAISPK